MQKLMLLQSLTVQVPPDARSSSHTKRNINAIE